MQETLKKDYLTFIFKRTVNDLWKQNVRQEHISTIRKISERLLRVMKYFSAEGEVISDGNDKVSFNLDSAAEESEKTEEEIDIEAELKKMDESEAEAREGEDGEEDEELVKFRQNYMELLRTEEEVDNAAFELQEKMEMVMGDGGVLPGIEFRYV
ncbi:MAG: hypothetical protein IPM38_09565 [Ignavibacteria bacterium]|nr:hypothetical protein [Ignavibacteria bacterium]